MSRGSGPSHEGQSLPRRHSGPQSSPATSRGASGGFLPQPPQLLSVTGTEREYAVLIGSGSHGAWRLAACAGAPRLSVWKVLCRLASVAISGCRQGNGVRVSRGLAVVTVCLAATAEKQIFSVFFVEGNKQADLSSESSSGLLWGTEMQSYRTTSRSAWFRDSGVNLMS